MLYRIKAVKRHKGEDGWYAAGRFWSASEWAYLDRLPPGIKDDPALVIEEVEIEEDAQIEPQAEVKIESNPGVGEAEPPLEPKSDQTQPEEGPVRAPKDDSQTEATASSEVVTDDEVQAGTEVESKSEDSKSKTRKSQLGEDS
jgi:hypothetical protein